MPPNDSDGNEVLTTNSDDSEEGKGSKKKLRDRVRMTPLRINVLLLIGAGYLSILIIFWKMAVYGGMDVEEAYEVVKGPLMALIGGSLAISKDLIPLD
ncbi:MAG: hypothetical protein OXI06_08805 [bacterium]|nr:hypothetical protein [bacterium]